MLPKRPLNELDLRKFASGLTNFRGVFMRDELPPKPRINECGILNLNLSTEDGSHWVAWSKRGKDSLYFDGFGNLQPPNELISYLGNNIKYNFESYQNYNTIICGHLCLIFLYMCMDSTIRTNIFK